MVDLYTVYFRCTLQGYDVVDFSSKHHHSTAHCKELQGFKGCSSVRLDELLSGSTYGIRSDCKWSYFNLG